VLCSHNKTYHIRQQQTSNSLFIVKPRQGANEDGNYTNELSTIASCTHTLELFPNKDSAEAYLNEFLTPWDRENEEMELEGRTKEDVYGNIPLSVIEIDGAWDNLYAFEHNGVCYLPRNSALLSTWKSIVAAAFAERIDLMDHGQDRLLWESVSEENIPLSLYHVIMSRSRAPDGAIWVARTYLESLQARPMPREDFLNSVQELIPRNMKPTIDLDVIKVCSLAKHILFAANSLGIRGLIRSHNDIFQAEDR
jgi:hypothetical protein